MSISIDCVDNVIRIGYKPSDLIGIGSEYLVNRETGDIVAVFYNGFFAHTIVVGNADVTAKAA
jgi:hypothetical protein